MKNRAEEYIRDLAADMITRGIPDRAIAYDAVPPETTGMRPPSWDSMGELVTEFAMECGRQMSDDPRQFKFRTCNGGVRAYVCVRLCEDAPRRELRVTVAIEGTDDSRESACDAVESELVPFANKLVHGMSYSAALNALGYTATSLPNETENVVIIPKNGQPPRRCVTWRVHSRGELQLGFDQQPEGEELADIRLTICGK